MNNNNDLFRYERKFILEKFSINSLEDLKIYTPANLYEKYQERIVNSIYFDNLSFSLAYANIDGISNKLKVRIRYIIMRTKYLMKIFGIKLKLIN